MENIGKDHLCRTPQVTSKTTYQFNELLDGSFLEYQYEGDLEQIYLVFNIFLSITSNEFEDLMKEIEEMDLEAIIKKVHKIKPNFQLVGLKALHKKLLVLENNGLLIGKAVTLKKLNAIYQLYKNTYHPILLLELEKLEEISR